ncbi:MAG: lysophospholipid acyltransferase family protein [Planctomycetota bacterium]
MGSRLEAFFRILLYPVAEPLSRVVFDLRFEEARFIPRRGPALLVANHQGYLDPFFLQMATVRPIRYMMTSDFYDLRAFRPFFRFVGAIRVPERGPTRDAIRDALRVLEEGGIVGIFPEGQLSRDGELGQALPGAAFLAARSGAPVVPARIRGSIDVLPKGQWLPRQAPVRIRFGPPLLALDRSAAPRILEAVSAL